MLTDDQVSQFKLFGFVILKNVFTQSELATLRAEFIDAAARTEASEGAFDGTTTHTFSMLGEDTPFYSSLLEDSRFYGPASQLFGDDVFGLETNSYRYVSNSAWHFNDGAPNIHGYGPKYQFPIFEPTRADTGALRFIPGSHKNSWQSELTQWWPLARGSARSEQGMGFLDKVPCVVAEADPGDAVLFDMRLIHATSGGSKDRRMSCVTYYHYPKTPRELEVMRVTAQGFYESPTRWNKAQWDEWFSNPHDSPLRQRWIDSWKRLAKTQQSETGLRLVFDEHGAATFAPLG
jgi:ectoine hydroxylase-related dioxygenase (phytanoyl-CoA dioxygenase family)